MHIRFFLTLVLAGCTTAHEPQGEIVVSAIEVFQKTQYHLSTYPSHPGEEEVLAADAVVSTNASFAAEGLVYEIQLDQNDATADQYLYWCKLSEIRGGGNAAPYVIPVDIASSIEGNLVRFDYSFTGNRSFILSCEFAGLEVEQNRIGFTAALAKILEPRVTPAGDRTIIYGGTNRSAVMRTAYLVPHDN